MIRVPNILVIDDEVEVGTFFDFLLREKGFEVSLANSGAEAKRILTSTAFDLAVVDLKLPDTNGIRLLEHIKQINPDCQVIIMTGYSTVKSAVGAIKLGAYDYIEKPFDDIERLEQLIDRALTTTLSTKVRTENETTKLLHNYGIITAAESPLVSVLSLANKIAAKDINVLIQGETGVGKELVARFIHGQSNRGEHPFIAVNCGAFTENLLESELFGHEKGAFTGAHGARRGIFQLADGGTLFLDEIGNASMGIQVKLLRVLETGEFISVGGERILNTDIRVIAATNMNLAEAVKTERFREDLFYRLDVVSLEIPPLRQRSCDIPLLVQYFISRSTKDKVKVHPTAMEILSQYHWPGNVRELANVIAQAVALCEGTEILPEYLPGRIIRSVKQTQEPGLTTSVIEAVTTKEIVRSWSEVLVKQLNPLQVDLKELLAELKTVQGYVAKQIIEEVLSSTNGDRARAAEILNASPRALRYLQNEK